MKNYVLAIATLLSLAVISCKKDSQPDKGEDARPKYAVQFDFNEFTFTEGGFGDRIIVDGDSQLAKDTLKKYANYLVYLVWDVNGATVRDIRQNSNNPDFGLIRDSLPMGRYTVAVLATKDSVVITSGYLEPEKAIFALPGNDAFYKRSIFNVDGNVNETIGLDRIMAKLQINIQDKMPYSADNMTILPQAYPGEPNIPMGHVGHYCALELSTGEYAFDRRGYDLVYAAYTHPIPEAIRNTTNTWFDYYVLALKAEKIKVSFTVKDNNDNILGNKTVFDVAIEPNKKTILYGNLFDELEADTSGVGVILDPAWGDSTKVDF